MGNLYTLDEMADDLNADKQIEALGCASSNTLYEWLNHTPLLRQVPAGTEVQAQTFVDAVNDLERSNRMTACSGRLSAPTSDAPLLLVQGPPGTGKSHTIGWAVINRMLLAHAAGRPCPRGRGRTHAQRRQYRLGVDRQEVAKTGHVTPARSWPRGVGLLRVVKLGGEDGNGAPEGVELVEPLQAGAEPRRPGRSVLCGRRQHARLSLQPGALPWAGRRKRTVDWTAKPFDLLVIDEASQMSVPEAVLAAAFLQKEARCSSSVTTARCRQSWRTPGNRRRSVR